MAVLSGKKDICGVKQRVGGGGEEVVLTEVDGRGTKVCLFGMDKTSLE